MANLPGDLVAKPAGNATAQPGDSNTATATATLTATVTPTLAKKVTFDEASGSEVNRIEKSGDGASASGHDGLASGGDGDPAGLATATVTAEHLQLGDEPQKKNKKRKKKKRTAASRKHITGFEEFYADAPITPAEATLEKEELYSPTRSFSDRIEECLQRYRSRRRLDIERTNMFNKYLFLGGIDTSPRQFTGMAEDADALADADAAEVRRMTAIDFIGGGGSRFYDDAYAQGWVVDFEAIVKGFLSRSILDMYMYDEEAIEKAAGVVKNFLNYVLMHDVCPEYRHNILAARDICDIAPTELRYLHELSLKLPGPFNSAARLLFCDGGANDLDDAKNLGSWDLFRSTMLIWAADHKDAMDALIKPDGPSSFRVLRTKQQTYRVIETARPQPKDVAMVKGQLAQSGISATGMALVRAVPDVIAHGWGNIPRPDEVDLSDAHVELFLIEDELAAKLCNGMKARMTVCELGVGTDAVMVLRFIVGVIELRVSFDTFLPQYLMAQWKDPVANERPAPSVHDKNPSADVNVHAQEEGEGEGEV